jgi:hypothetical protein
MHATTTIPVEIILLPERCYRCGRITAPVVGLRFSWPGLGGDSCEALDDGSCFVEYGHDTA